MSKLFAPLIATSTIAIALFAMAGPPPAKPPGDAGPDKLLNVMTDPMVSFDDRARAEDELAKLPPEVVLPKLLPLVAKGMPEAGIWNSAGREHERTGPIPWQIYYAVQRSWNEQIGSPPRDEARKTLFALLQGVAKGKERNRVVESLADCWDPRAETILADILRDVREPREIRWASGHALVVNGKKDYRDTMLQAAALANHREKSLWYELLADPRLKERTGVDPRVVQLGFQLIQTERNDAPKDANAGYQLAMSTGYYLGETFFPKNRDRYLTATGNLREQYFADTVSNALGWWDKNRGQFEKTKR